jgi:dTMP kinase
LIYLLKTLTRGVLIVLEGIDGSGKTTQITKVAEFLQSQNYTVTITHEPNHNSPYYKLIKEKVKKQREKTSPREELELYVKDRKWDLKNNILPALDKNHVVLVDRYYMSNAAYQGALDSFTIEKVLEMNSFAPKPHLWIILDVSVELGQARIRDRDNKGNDQLEIAEYQAEVRKNYVILAKMNLGGEIRWVDASCEEEELTNKIGKVVLEFLQKVK